MGGYVLINLAAITGAFDDMKSPATWIFALVVSAPVAGHLWAVLAWLRDSDEFVRTVAAKRLIVGTGITLALASAWGFLEIYAKAPHVPAALLLPLFWLSFATVTPFIRTSH
jgi:hypothetical protein